MNIPVVFIADDNYVIPTGVAIASMISSKKPDTHYDIYIVCASLSAESEAAFSVFASDTVSVHIIREDANRFAGLHQFASGAACVATPSALLKFVLPELLPGQDKVLYLDGDILVRTDLSELYATDLEDNMVAAVIDSGSIYYKQKFTSQVEHYFNSGVMVLNLKQMRLEHMTETLIRTKQELNDSNLMDQNVLNVVFDHRVKCLPIWYNFLAINLHRARKKWELSDINELYGTQFQSREELFDSWKILHFSSKDKPWKNPFALYANKWIEVYRSLPNQSKQTDASERLPEVSILMVVHDEEKSLRQCLDSILIQSLREIEVICIADSISEHTAALLKQYEQQDRRLCVLNDVNREMGAVFSSALAQAQGEYVLFLDDNVILSLDTLKKASLTARKNQADIALLSGKKYDDRNRNVQERSEFLRRELLPNQQAFSRKDVPDNLFAISSPVLWNKLYSRRFLQGSVLSIQPPTESDDFYYACNSMALAERITAVDTDLIYYRVNRLNNSQRNKVREPLCFLYELDDLYRTLLKQNLFEAVQTSYRHLALSTIITHLKNGNEDEVRIQILEALDREPFCQLPIWEEPGTDDGNHMVRQYSSQLSAARNWYHQNRWICALAERGNGVQQREISCEWDKILVSVIIPVYNTALYLDETLNAIVNQTLKEIEIICIDDGSTDESLEILKRWAAKDERFVIITQSNSRQRYARNVGISCARGKYLYFMDSDDLLERQALEELVATMEEKQLECLLFDGTTFFEDAELATEFARFDNNYIRSRSYDGVYDGATLLRLICTEENKFTPNPCIEIMRTDFVRENGIRFPVGVFYEDNAFTFAMLLHAKRASHVQRAYFLRRIRRNSTMTADLTFETVYGYYTVFLDMVQTYFEVADSLTDENRNVAIDRLMVILRNAQDNYANLPAEYAGSELGMQGSLSAFQTFVCNGGKRQIRALNAKLQTAWAEKADLRRRLQTAWAENADLRRRLQTAWSEKAELRRRLELAWSEKSEIKRKLQIAYDEKLDRGVQIKALKQQQNEWKSQQKALEKQVSALKKENAVLKKENKAQAKKMRALRRSASFRIGRVITWPVRKLRGLLVRLRK